jgi:hypothetical protein
MGAWVLLLLITTGGAKITSLQVTPIYFQNKDACTLAANGFNSGAKAKVAPKLTMRAICYSTENGTEAAN